jgi:hypothetical protein
MKFMKRIFFLVAVVFVSTISFAQSNSIIGKWKFASITTADFSVDLENPASMKKMLIEQIEKEGGKVPDSVELNAGIEMMSSMFRDMRMEFTTDGKAIAFIPDPSGSGKVIGDTAKFTVDYTKGVMNTVSVKEGKEKKEQMTFKFDGEYLVMTKPDENESIKMKRVK